MIFEAVRLTNGTSVGSFECSYSNRVVIWTGKPGGSFWEIEMDAAQARRIARLLRKHADVIDPPKKRKPA